MYGHVRTHIDPCIHQADRQADGQTDRQTCIHNVGTETSEVLEAFLGETRYFWGSFYLSTRLVFFFVAWFE